MCEPLRFCQITLAPPQRCFRLLALGDVDHGAHKFNEIAGWTDNGMTYAWMSLTLPPG